MAKSVTAQWAQKNIDSIELIDVRTPAEYFNFHIKGSKNIPISKILEDTSQYINKNDTYYITCSSGGRSGTVISKLKEVGYNNLIQVEDGVLSLISKK